MGHQCSVNSVMGSRRCLALKQSRGCLGSAETGGEVGCTKGHKNNNARAACSNTRERLPARTMPGKHAAELGQHRAFCPSCLPSQACRFSVLLAEREAIILDNGQGMLGTAKNADNRPAKTCKKLKNKPKQASVWPRVASPVPPPTWQRLHSNLIFRRSDDSYCVWPSMPCLFLAGLGVSSARDA